MIHKITNKIGVCLLCFFAVCFTVESGFAQNVNSNCNPSMTEDNYAFQDGEELTYLANYSWGLISTDVGEATMKLNRITSKGIPYFFVEATAKTYKFYDKFFMVRDTYICRFSAQNLKPAYFHRNINEGGYFKKNTMNFDWDAMLLKSTNQTKKNPAKDTVLALTNCTFDVLTLLYYSRNIDFSFVNEGDAFPLTFAIDDEIYNIKFRFLKKETISLKDFGNFRCLKFAVEVVAGDVFTGESEIIMWITDDRNHIPLKIESPIIVGSVKAYVVKMKNIKHALTSK